MKSKCKYCLKEYDMESVKRSNGEHSSVYQQGFCSASCYTKNTLKHDNKEVHIQDILYQTDQLFNLRDKLKDMKLYDLATQIQIITSAIEHNCEKLLKDK